MLVYPFEYFFYSKWSRFKCQISSFHKIYVFIFLFIQCKDDVYKCLVYHIIYISTALGPLHNIPEINIQVQILKYRQRFN